MGYADAGFLKAHSLMGQGVIRQPTEATDVPGNNGHAFFQPAQVLPV